jgi:two-component system OmpR family response regulator
MRILLLEDDPRTAAFIRKGLKEAGFVVEHLADGADGRFSATHETYDAAIIDVMLPGLSGLEVVKAMRDARITTPVLFLSALGALEDKVTGLRAGGDDYLTKPFAFTELLWRVHALIRRSQHQEAPTRLAVADLVLDLTRRAVIRGNRKIELQPREFMLLEYLMRNAGRLVTKTMILEHVWEYDFDPHTNIVESRISRLRSKVDVESEHPLIQTIRGAGYILKAHD